MDFLQLQNKHFLIFGVANKKSVAYQIATMLLNENAFVDLVVRDESVAEKVRPLFPQQKMFVCNVENESEIVQLRRILEAEGNEQYDGLVHSIAFADYGDGMKPFHETPK